eukprot:6263144-Alexandrium_andersonii.AAC.1
MRAIALDHPLRQGILSWSAVLEAVAREARVESNQATYAARCHRCPPLPPRGRSQFVIPACPASLQ